MTHTMRRSLAGHLDHVYYSLLRATVTRFVPEVLRFDDQDPLLGAGFAPEHRAR